MSYEGPVFVDHGRHRLTDFDSSSIWKRPDVDASFSFVNFDYPYLHVHKDFCEILFVYSGTIINYVNGESVAMHAGDCCIMLQSDKHKIEFPPDNREGLVAINFPIRERYFERIRYAYGEEEAKLFEHPTEMMRFRVDEMTCRSVYNQALLMQTPDNIYDEKNEFACKKIILDLLAEYIRQKLHFASANVAPQWLREMLVRMQDRNNVDKNPNFFIKDVSYSYSYVAKEFKRYMGCSVMSYLTFVKLNYAKELLASTDMTTIEIALRIGLSSLSHFNHVFKKYFGQTPSEVRRKKESLPPKV